MGVSQLLKIYNYPNLSERIPKFIKMAAGHKNLELSLGLHVNKVYVIPQRQIAADHKSAGKNVYFAALGRTQRYSNYLETFKVIICWRSLLHTILATFTAVPNPETITPPEEDCKSQNAITYTVPHLELWRPSALPRIFSRDDEIH